MTTTDVAVPTSVVDVRTGEFLSIADLPAATEYLNYLRSAKNELAKILEDLQTGLLATADARAEWRFPVGAGWILECDPPTKTDVYWDCDVLDELFDSGLLPEDRRADLISTKVERRGRTRPLQLAARAGGEVADIIERAEHRPPARRYANARRVAP